MVVVVGGSAVGVAVWLMVCVRVGGTMVADGRVFERERFADGVGVGIDFVEVGVLVLVDGGVLVGVFDVVDVGVDAFGEDVPVGVLSMCHGCNPHTEQVLGNSITDSQSLLLSVGRVR